MLSYSVECSASADTAWRLLSHPGQWHRWAPHIRRASGLGSPEVQAGRVGLVWLLAAVPVPARIVAAEPGRSWDWRVGPVLMRHRVQSAGTGCTVTIEIEAPGPLEASLRMAYGPIIRIVLRNLARVAASDDP